MTRYLVAIAIVVIIIVLAIIWGDGTVLVTADDGQQYRVLNRPGKQTAANTLARLNRDTVEFLRWLMATSSRLPLSHQKIIGAILHGYNFETMRENNPRNWAGDTSYTVRKGESIYVCLRRRDNPAEFIPYNVVLYVLLHEISHIGHYSGWGHSNDFWEIFLLILKLAVEFGIYKPYNYAAKPVVYCGLTINYCPLFDPTARLPA